MVNNGGCGITVVAGTDDERAMVLGGGENTRWHAVVARVLYIHCGGGASSRDVDQPPRYARAVHKEVALFLAHPESLALDVDGSVHLAHLTTRVSRQ